MTAVWAVLLVALIIVEASTTQLVCIWFALGALCSLIVSLFGEHFEWIEVIVFIAVSLISLIATRPLVKKITKAKIQPTNADMCIGKTALITQTVDNDAGTGQAIEWRGAYSATRQSGLHFKIPLIERVAKTVSLKEQVVDFPPQPVITKDNVTMQIDTVVFFQITDP